MTDRTVIVGQSVMATTDGWQGLGVVEKIGRKWLHVRYLSGQVRYPSALRFAPGSRWSDWHEHPARPVLLVAPHEVLPLDVHRGPA